MGIIRVQIPKPPAPLTKEEIEAMKRVWVARGNPYRRPRRGATYPDGMEPRCYWRWYCDFCLKGQNRMYSEADAREAATLHKLRRHPQLFKQKEL
jgi:hypothetical protein